MPSILYFDSRRCNYRLKKHCQTVVCHSWVGSIVEKGGLPSTLHTCACVCSSEGEGLHTADEPVTDTSLLSWFRHNLSARVWCAALPVQLLAFALLGFAAIVPLCEQDCVPPNSFLYSLHPLYRYTDGQPPV